MKTSLLVIVFGCLTIPFNLDAQQPPFQRTYKTVDTTKLILNLFYPSNYAKNKKLPAIILFFGGGWNTGTISQLEPQAKHFASEGMVAITADYRVKNRHNTSPFEAVKDAKSAIRYVRQHAVELGIDPARIAAGGGSAGGHIAAAADLTSLEETNENHSISSRPNALILFNPVFNNGPGQYGYERVGERYREISPYHNIRKGAAPTIAFFGSDDKLVHPPIAELYKKAMEDSGNRCELFIYEGQQHGFFNYKKDTVNIYYDKVLAESVKFLKSIGYIE